MKKITIVLSALAFLFCNCSPVFAESVKWKELQALPFPENYPTKETADRLYDEMLFHRANTGCPLVIASHDPLGHEEGIGGTIR